MPSFRYRIVLWVAHQLGRFVYRAQRGVWPPLYRFILTFVGVFLADWIHHFFFSKAYPWFQWWIVLLTFVVLELLVYAFQARKRMVIENFTDYTGAQSTNDSHGLSALLVVKLAQLHDLYREVNEQRAVTTAIDSTHPIDATIKVDDISDFLSEAISVQTTVNVGPLQIPIGTVMALVGRLVQGPRIVGSLHKDHGSLILMAQQVGTRPAYKWRVESVADSTGQANMDNMVSELAYRIFTDVALSGTVRWKATKAFSEGLRSYRNILRITKDRRINLRKAEHKFLKTLEEDSEFDLAHYNLGVVYMESGQMNTASSPISAASNQANKIAKSEQLAAAEEAFLQAISCNPGIWVNYYALAICRYQCKEYGAVIQLCDRIRRRMVAKKPGKLNIAKIYHMKGLAQNAHNGHSAAIKNLRKAVRQAWFALCLAELLQLGVSGTENLIIPQLKVTLGICLKDLAQTYMDSARTMSRKNNSTGVIQSNTASGKVDKKSFNAVMDKEAFEDAKKYYTTAKELLGQATFLIAADGKNYSELFKLYTENFINLGDLYCEQHLYKSAIKEYESALRWNPENASYWVYLARAYNKNGQKKAAKKACLEAMESTTTLIDCICDENTGKICLWHELATIFASCDTSIDAAQIKQGIKTIDIEKGIKVLQIVALQCSHDASAMSPVDIVGEIGETVREIEEIQESVRGWIYAQVALPVANMYLKYRQYKPAEEFIAKAIACLEETYAHVISAQELRVILVYALLQQGNYEKALEQVEYARSLDPLCYREWVAQGDVYFKLNAFQNAIDAWKEALLRQNSVGFRPDGSELPYIESPVLDFKLSITYALNQKDVDINFKIGISYIELGRHHSDAAKKRDAYRQAINYLELAETLYEGDYDRQQQKQYLYYFLGVLYFEQGDYQRAISSLRVAKTLSFAPLTALFYLAYTYLKNREYDSAIKHFQILRDNAQKMECEMKLDTIVEADSVGFMPLGELLAMANWGIAFAYAERDANLEEAQTYICKAHSYMDQLSVGTKTHWPAYIFDCEGWILFKLEKSADALKALQRAVTLSAFPQAYIHLSYVYISQLQQMNPPNIAVAQQLRSCYQHALTLDIQQEFAHETSYLSQYVQKYGSN